jgi:hypothetical protein
MQATAVTIILLLIMTVLTGCFSGSANSGNIKETQAPIMVNPEPRIESVVTTTSGSKHAYFATLDIKVTNDGAEGLILVRASITQNGQTYRDEMEVFLKQGRSHELKLTFPLIWQGGEFTSNVEAIVP